MRLLTEHLPSSVGAYWILAPLAAGSLMYFHLVRPVFHLGLGRIQIFPEGTWSEHARTPPDTKLSENT